MINWSDFEVILLITVQSPRSLDDPGLGRDDGDARPFLAGASPLAAIKRAWPAIHSAQDAGASQQHLPAYANGAEQEFPLRPRKFLDPGFFPV